MKISSKRVCNKCGQTAKIWYNNNWWCEIKVGLGEYNLIGYCKKENKNDVPNT